MWDDRLLASVGECIVVGAGFADGRFFSLCVGLTSRLGEHVSPSA
jgi:hypothetical protein